MPDTIHLCQASCSKINSNLFIFKIYLPLRLTLVSVFENAKENV